MSSFKIHPQSIIDIITNSSTEIYTFPSTEAPRLVKQIVNKVLEEAGTEKRFDDLFEIAIVRSEGAQDEFESWLQWDCPEEMDSDNALNKKDAKLWIKENKKKADKLFKKFTKHSERLSDYPGMANDIEVRTKDGADTGLTNLIRNVFDTKEIHD